MRGILILCVIAAANAAPQYNYQPPAQPAQSYLPPGGHAAAQPVQSYLPPGGHNSAHSQHGHQQSFGSQNAGSSFGGGLGGGQFGQQHHHHQQQPATITKNFYIHSAPEDRDDDDLSQQHGGGGRKNYRIVFIKAPSQSSTAAALKLAQGQNEEKTVIYVLSKKVDASDLQSGLDAAHGAQSKPEVFFIKYKTPEEAEHAQHQIQAQYDSLGGGPTHVSDEGVAPVQSFIGALGDSSHGHNAGHDHSQHGGHGAGGAGHGGHGSQGVASNYLPSAF